MIRKSNWLDQTSQVASICILANLLITPAWLRMPSLSILPDLFVIRFTLLIPMILVVLFWMLGGFHGWRNLINTPLRIMCFGSMVMLALWSILSNTWAFMSNQPPNGPNYHPEVAINASIQLTLVILFAIATACIPPRLSHVTGIIVFLVLTQSIIIILQAVLQSSIGLGFLGEFEVWLDKPGVSTLVAGDLRWLRPYGLLPHPNNAGGFIAFGTLVCSGWLLSRVTWQRWVGFMTFSLGFWALMLTFSRGAWIGFVCGGIVLSLALWPQRNHKAALKIYLLTLVLMLTLAVIFFVIHRPLIIARAAPLTGPEITLDAIERGEIEAIETRSISDRRVFMRFAWDAIRENPILGVGIGNFPWKASSYLMDTNFDLRANYVHNIYLAVWADLGFVGIGLYSLGIITGLMVIIKELRQTFQIERAALLSAICAIGITGFFDYYTWALIMFQVLWWGCIVMAMQPQSHLSAVRQNR